MSAKFFVHNENDSVGVAVADIVDGEMVTGWLMDKETEVSVKAMADIPLGHKIALRNISAGAQVIKYGEPIGKTVAEIKTGEHVHIHNLKSARW